MRGTLLCIIGVATAVAAFTPEDYTERCRNLPHEDSAKTAIETYLRKIPKMYDFSRPDRPFKSGGIVFTALNITGLGDLWPYRPPRIYCTSNRGVVEASLFAAVPLQLILSVETCSEVKANLTLSAASARLTAIFNIDERLQADGKLSLKLGSVYPEDVENVALSIQGLGGPVDVIVRSIGVVLNPHLETFWRGILRSDIQYIMNKPERDTYETYQCVFLENSIQSYSENFNFLVIFCCYPCVKSHLYSYLST